MLQKNKILKIFIIICLVLVMFFIVFFLTGDMRKYSKANKFAKKGMYEQAISLYEQISDYKDSSKLIANCSCSIAEEKIENKEYDEAKTILYNIKDQVDVTNDIDECNYYISESLIKEAKYSEAIDLLEGLTSEKESARNKFSIKIKIKS